MAWFVPDPYPTAIRGPVTIRYTVDATRGGQTVAAGLTPLGGSITDTTKAGIRRSLSLELAPARGLFDALAPTGTRLAVTCHVQYANRAVADIPMGVFVIDGNSIAEGGGSITLSAPDKWAEITRARFVGPASSNPALTVTSQIATLIKGGLGADEPVNVLSGSTVRMTQQTWEKDRDKAILDAATAIGAWVYFDRQGVATIADQPAPGASAHWTADASSAGVLTELDRERSRGDVYNVVVVSSSATEGELFPTQWVWDTDPASPTYAGTDPRTAPETAGPFGISVAYYDTPLLRTVSAARAAGGSILRRTRAIAEKASWSQVPNPAVDAGDLIDVLPPPAYRGHYPHPERHLADTVTHPLTVGPEQNIDGRSSRWAEIEGVS